MELILALGCGVAIGSVLGFVGAGGSMLAVPMFIYLFDFTVVQATTASLIVVFSGALSGVIPKIRKGEVLIKDGSIIWAIGLITNLGGAYLLPKIDERIIVTGFALVLISAGISMLLPTPKVHSEKSIPVAVLILISLLIGAMTGLFGIGGGFLAIPILILFFHVPPVKAAGTSLFIITINTVTGFMAHARHWGEVTWSYPFVIALVAIVVSRIASHRSSSVSPITLKRAFAGLVFSIAIFSLVQTWIVS